MKVLGGKGGGEEEGASETCARDIRSGRSEKSQKKKIDVCLT